MSDAIAEAIKNGKTQDAIEAYTQAIVQGIALKFNFQGILENA